MTQARVAELLKTVHATANISGGGLDVTSPSDGASIAKLTTDTSASINAKIKAAASAHASWAKLPRDARISLLEIFSAALRTHRETLGELVTLEAGKTAKEAIGEVDSAADVILKTIKDATLPELGGMLRRKEREPLGIVGLITSFNFPIAVAHWTLAPALLAGNAVIWKPSEKTPLIAIAVKSIWDNVAGGHKDLVQIAIGGRDIGEALVAHEQVVMISATGSVGMGKAIHKTLEKKSNSASPILELGGNNAAVISNKISDSHLTWAVSALFTSFLGTSGQRCTNTRRLIVHRAVFDKVVALFSEKISAFLASGAVVSPLSGASNEFGYGPLIDADAFSRFEKAKTEVVKQGGRIVFGGRLLAKEYPDAYYVEPTLAILPSHSAIMHEETFAPILFIAPYDGGIEEAAVLANAPANSGLVGAIYTQSQKEADIFAALNGAGHTLINSAKGTGTPAHGMGFGGNKDSGVGEILNAADPLAAFTRHTHYSRIAQNKDIAMDAD